MRFRTILLLLTFVVTLAGNLPGIAGAYTREELVCPVREDWVEGEKACFSGPLTFETKRTQRQRS